MVRLTDRLDMTISDIWEVVPLTKQTEKKVNSRHRVQFQKVGSLLKIDKTNQ